MGLVSRLLIVALICSVAMVASAQMQQTSAAGAQSADQSAMLPPALAPYVGPGTVSVARLDISRVDLDATAQWLGQLAKADDADEATVQKRRQQREQWLGEARVRVDALRDAGVTQVYLLGGTTAGQPGPLMIVPLDHRADAQAIQTALQGFAGDSPMPLETQVNRNAVVMGPPQALAAKTPAGGEPPEGLAAALQALDDNAFQIVIVPNSMTEMLLTGLAAQGGQVAQARDLAQNIRWLALTGDTPPNASMRLLVEAQSPQAADQIRQIVADALNRVAAPAAGEQENGQRQEVVAALRPTIHGSRVSITLNQEQLTRLATIAAQSQGQMVHRRRGPMPDRAPGAPVQPPADSNGGMSP